MAIWCELGFFVEWATHLAGIEKNLIPITIGSQIALISLLSNTPAGSMRIAFI
jgi:hypothetical protein